MNAEEANGTNPETPQQDTGDAEPNVTELNHGLPPEGGTPTAAQEAGPVSSPPNPGLPPGGGTPAGAQDVPETRYFKTAPKVRRDGLGRPPAPAPATALRPTSDDDEDDDDSDDLLDPADFDELSEWDQREVVRAMFPPVVFGRSLRRALDKSGVPNDWDVVADSGPKPDPLIFELACDVTQAATAWLWPGRIPLERITLLAGDDDGSASLVARDLAARVSRGAGWPDDPPSGSGAHGTHASPPLDPVYSTGVVYCTTRYDKATTCVPGLIQADARMHRVLCLDGVLDPSGIGKRCCFPMRLPEHISNLRTAIRRLDDVRLVVLDPIEAFFPRSAGRRGIVDAVAGLRDLAYDIGVAVVAVTRLKANAPGRGDLLQVLNPVLADEATTVWGIVRANDDRDRLQMRPIKMGVAGEVSPLGISCDDDAAPGRLTWELDPPPLGKSNGHNLFRGIERDEANRWLRRALSRGNRPVQELKEEARMLGIAPSMLKKVKRDLGIVSENIPAFQGGNTWRMPSTTLDVVRELGVHLAERGSTLEDSAEIPKVEHCTAEAPA